MPSLGLPPLSSIDLYDASIHPSVNQIEKVHSLSLSRPLIPLDTFPRQIWPNCPLRVLNLLPMGMLFLPFYESVVGNDAEQKQSKLHVAKDSVLAQSHTCRVAGDADWLTAAHGREGGRRNE